MSPETALLEVRGLTAGYRGLQALHGIDLDVAPGEIVAVVGANGAGKVDAAAGDRASDGRSGAASRSPDKAWRG